MKIILLGLLLSSSWALARDYDVQFPGNKDRQSQFQTIDHVVFSDYNVTIEDDLDQAFSVDQNRKTIEETWQCQNWLDRVKNKLQRDSFEVYEVDFKTLTRDEYKKEYDPYARGGSRRDVGLCRITFLKKSNLNSIESKTLNQFYQKFKNACIVSENGKQSPISVYKNATWPFIHFGIDSDVYVSPFSTLSESSNFMSYAQKDKNGNIEKVVLPATVSSRSKLISDEEKKQRDLDNAQIVYDLFQNTAKLVVNYKEPEDQKGFIAKAKKYIMNEPDPRLIIEMNIEDCK